MRVCDPLRPSRRLSLLLLSSRACLDLFPSPPPPAAQQELNLIAALGILDDFGLSLLPVQVRLSKERLDLVRKVLGSSTAAYRRHEKVGTKAYTLYMYVCMCWSFVCAKNCHHCMLTHM